jgi:serine/threonine protein kinase
LATKKIENIDEYNYSDNIGLKPSIKLNNGNYEILDQLGDPGGFGITYLGYDVGLKSKVAIKEYFPRTYANRDANMTIVPTASKEHKDNFKWGYDAFKKEAQTIANLPKHPNVIDVKNLFEENGTVYFVMSYAKGVDLECYLQDNHPMSQKEIEDILYPFLEGVKHIHKYNILHRDIKLANVLITEEKQPILIDFGTARNELNQRFKKMTAVYTEGYAALEQHTQSKEGPYTDIYAIGMMIYALINGITDTQLLPSAIKRFEAMHTKKSSLLTFPDDGRFTETFINAVKKALEIEAINRPQNIDELIALFKEKKKKPNKKSYLMTSLGVITLLGVGGGYFYLNKSNNLPINPPTPITKTTNLTKEPSPITESTPPSTDIPTIPTVTDEEEIDYIKKAQLAKSQGNIKKAIEYYTKAYKEGDATAAFELGTIYELTLKKPKSAIKWYEKAEELGNIKAQYPLSLLYCQKGNFRRFNNNKEMLEYAKGSRKEVKYDVGLCFKKQGNLKEAQKWFEESAKMGYNEAKSSLYILLRTELGYNDAKTRKYIENLNR